MAYFCSKRLSSVMVRAYSGYCHLSRLFRTKPLAERQERHVMAVRANFSVVLGRGPDRPVRRADEVLVAQPRRAWHSIAWSEGAKGWWRAKFLALRCWRVDGDGTRHVGWLIGQRPGRGLLGVAAHP